MGVWAIELRPDWYRRGRGATTLAVSADLYDTFHEATDELQRLKAKSAGDTYAQARVVPIGGEIGQ